MSDDYQPEFHSYCNEELKDSEQLCSNGKILGRTKPTIVTTHMCKLFCRGSDCRFCKPESKFFGDDMVVDGLYSSWVTSNIMAMARPSTHNITQFSIIDKFSKENIKTIVNMQKSGEHNFCGYPLDPSGFSYDPEHFMKNGIDCLNFPCEDYGVLRVDYLLDITKTIQYQLTRGKVAVHCHAGLGRTGLVIACYLIFNNRLSGTDAINYVRSKRRNSIQNTIQVDKIIEFAAYLRPFRCVIWTPMCDVSRFSVQEAVWRQKKLLHGNEALIVSHIPKIIYLCLRKVTEIAQEVVTTDNDLFDSQDTGSSDCNEDLMVTKNSNDKSNHRSWLSFQRWNRKIRRYFNKSISEDIAKTILYCFTHPYTKYSELDNIKNELNTTDETWKKLYDIDDIHLHCQLVVDYLHSLKFPVLRAPDLEMLTCDDHDDPMHRLMKLETCVGRTLAVLLSFLNQCKCLEGAKLWQLRSVLFSRLTHKNVFFCIEEPGYEQQDWYPFDLSGSHIETLKAFLKQTWV